MIEMEKLKINSRRKYSRFRRMSGHAPHRLLKMVQKRALSKKREDKFTVSEKIDWMIKLARELDDFDEYCRRLLEYDVNWNNPTHACDKPFILGIWDSAQLTKKEEKK